MSDFNTPRGFAQTDPEHVEGSEVLSPTPHTCKVCAGPVQERHRIQDIPYYHCSACNFLQVFYWEENPTAEAEQQAANDKRRQERWPAGERDHMYEKGWNMLELMGWPLAWSARRPHTMLKQIPGYNAIVKGAIKNRFKRLLDFGCGHGVSVLELRARDGFDIVGLDPFSPTTDPHIILTPLKDRRFADGEFDGIFTIETMEHITNVLEIFSELHRILKTGGVLLVQTSRLEDPKYQSEGEKWFYLEDPKTHVAIYSEETMRRIAEKTGFRSVQFKGVKFAKFTK